MAGVNFGKFVGSTLGGVLVDAIGFVYTSAIFLCCYIIMAIIDVIQIAWDEKQKKYKYDCLP